MKHSLFAAAIYLLVGPACLAAPLVQNPHAREGVSLDGEWARIVDPYENGYYNHRFEPHEQGYFSNLKQQTPSELIEYNFASSPRLQVPGDWNTQEQALFFYEGTVWYQRDFSLQKRPGRKYLIHFGAVNYAAIVFVNGRLVGRHEGGFTPFQFDVSDQLVDGENFVVVKADNRRERDNVPTVNTDWWNYGGITRSVRILNVPAHHLSDYALFLGENGRVKGWAQVTGPAGELGLRIADLGVNQVVEIDHQGRGQISLDVKPNTWSPDTPVLYDIRLEYNGEIVKDRIGFRKIEVAGPEILLNGRPMFLKGISLHEEKPDGDGRAWSEAHARRLLGWVKELGANFVRLAHYPHNENMLRVADELGLLVWSEIPVYWTVDFADTRVFAKAETQLSEMISRDRNRASVVLWSIANETPAGTDRLEFLTRLADTARKLDPTRLVTAALDTQSDTGGGKLIDDPLSSVVDVIGINSYCGWYGGTPESCANMAWHSKYGKPVIMSEFGAGALRGNHGPADHRWTEEYQAAVYRYNLEMIDRITFLRGMAPWILKDFRSPRRPLPGIQDYWNRKGLLSETGEKKASWQLLRTYYEKRAGSSP